MSNKIHRVFLEFALWEGEASGQHQYDFPGTMIHPKFWMNHKASRPGHLKSHYPAAGEQYFEWIALLETVLACRNQPEFSFAELGAGYGQWTVRAYRAFCRVSDAKIYLVVVEGERQHFEWIQEYLRNNGIDPREHSILHAFGADRSPVAKNLGPGRLACAV